MMDEGYKQIEKTIIPKILRSKVLLIATAAVWKTVRFYGVEKVTVESKASSINHYTLYHIALSSLHKKNYLLVCSLTRVL